MKRSRAPQPPKPPPLTSRLQRFYDHYTDGLHSRDLRRLFDKAAIRAYAVLTRGHDAEPEPKGICRRFFYRAKLAFLGLSYKLTPARRLLFAGSLLGFIIGLVGDPLEVKVSGQTRLLLDF